MKKILLAVSFLFGVVFSTVHYSYAQVITPDPGQGHQVNCWSANITNVGEYVDCLKCEYRAGSYQGPMGQCPAR